MKLEKAPRISAQSARYVNRLRPGSAGMGTDLARLRLLPELQQERKDSEMGRGILLWLIGVPIPVILLILLFWH